MHAIVKDIEVHTMPFTHGDGKPWDLFSGPDLYYEAYGPNEEIVHTSDVAPDVGPRDLPVTLGGGFSVETRYQHVLCLLDADLTGKEVITRIAFVPARWVEECHGPEPPSSTCLTDEDTALRLTLAWDQVQA